MHFKDREGRWTFFGYDALRQRTTSINPLGRVTRFHWCHCGALQDLWDAEAEKTRVRHSGGARAPSRAFSGTLAGNAAGT